LQCLFVVFRVVHENNVTVFNLMNFVDAGNGKVSATIEFTTDDIGNFLKRKGARQFHVLSKIRVAQAKKKGRNRGLLFCLSIGYFFTRS